MTYNNIKKMQCGNAEKIVTEEMRLANPNAQFISSWLLSMMRTLRENNTVLKQ